MDLEVVCAKRGNQQRKGRVQFSGNCEGNGPPDGISLLRIPRLRLWSFDGVSVACWTDE